ncbi:hypothetical protein BGZ65_009664, partial [Modicella reniformis]
IAEEAPSTCADEDPAANVDVDDVEKDPIPIGNPLVIKETKDIESPAVTFIGTVVSNASVD